QTINVTVTPVNDNAPAFSSSAAFNVAENTTAVGTVTATDADLPAQTVSFEISESGRAACRERAYVGGLTVGGAHDYAAPSSAGANNVYVEKVHTCQNVRPALFTEQTINVTVTPVNDNAPVFSSSAAFNVAENTTAVGTVTATDADLPAQTVSFEIS